jgi:hypothetical protein
LAFFHFFKCPCQTLSQVLHPVLSRRCYARNSTFVEVVLTNLREVRRDVRRENMQIRCPSYQRHSTLRGTTCSAMRPFQIARIPAMRSVVRGRLPQQVLDKSPVPEIFWQEPEEGGLHASREGSSSSRMRCRWSSFILRRPLRFPTPTLPGLHIRRTPDDIGRYLLA